MIRSRLRAALIIPILALAVAAATQANAQDVTLRFSGVITQLQSNPYADIAVGTPFVGTYTFSLGTPNQSIVPQVGDYLHNSAPYGVYVFVGAHVFRTNPTAVQFLMELADGYQGVDTYLFRSLSNLAADGHTIDSIGMQLDDPTQAALSSTALSATPPVPS